MSQDPKKPEQPTLTIDATVSMGQYSNFVSIAHNFNEVLLDFGRSLPGRKDIPVVSRLIMTPFHAKQLLMALQHNIGLYEQKFGPIDQPPQGTGGIIDPSGAN